MSHPRNCQIAREEMGGFGRWVIESSCLVTRRNWLQLRNKYVHQALQQKWMRSRTAYIHLNYNPHVSGKHPIEKNGDGILEKLFFFFFSKENFKFLTLVSHFIITHRRGRNNSENSV